jgi:putative spermidine/putrescine transport system permease protein
MWLKKKNKPYILVLPSLIFIIILFFGGLFSGLLQSVGLTSIGDVSQFSFLFYKELFKSNEFWSSFFLTLKISIVSTIVSGFLGMFIIFCIFIIRSGERGEKAQTFQRFFQIPMLFPYLVAAYIIFLMFTQSGWVSRILFNIGIINDMNEFPILINDEFGWGIIISYIWKTSPFVVLMVYPGVLKVEESWIEVGRVFGANRFKFFKNVVLSLLITPWKMACFIIFAYTFSAFEIPFLLGVTYPKTLSVYSYQMYIYGDLVERPKALAVNIIILLVIGIFGFIFCKVGRKKRV